MICLSELSANIPFWVTWSKMSAVWLHRKSKVICTILEIWIFMPVQDNTSAWKDALHLTFISPSPWEMVELDPIHKQNAGFPFFNSLGKTWRDRNSSVIYWVCNGMPDLACELILLEFGWLIRKGQSSNAMHLAVKGSWAAPLHIYCHSIFFSMFLSV